MMKDIILGFVALNILLFPLYIFFFFHFRLRKKYYTQKLEVIQAEYDNKINALSAEIEKIKASDAVCISENLERARIGAKRYVVNVTNNVHEREMTEQDFEKEMNELLDRYNKNKK